MRHQALLLCLVSAIMAVAIPASPAAAKDPEPWPPITQEELALKDCPQQPGASAIYLLREDVRDFEKFEWRYFRRIKILTAAGRDRANVEIPYFKGEYKIVGLEARVFHPDSAAPRIFGGQVFDKTAFRLRGTRMTLKTFALPDVDVGCIIEYRYRFVGDSGGGKAASQEDILNALQISPGKPPEGSIGEGMDFLTFPNETWDIQEDLFTRKAKFVYVPSRYEGLVMRILLHRPGTMMWFAQRMPEIQPVMKNGRLELEVENIPAFEAEELMTPEASEKMVVNLLYCAADIQDDYWKVECESWQKAAEGFIGGFLGKQSKVAAEARNLVAGIDDPAAKLQKIYERAQRIRNLSYEKYMTDKQRKALKLKYNEKASDVLERDYGYRSDITRAFVALARAAGFEAEVVRVSTRDDKIFMIKLFSFFEQLDSELALVKLGGQDVLFDPATPFCPFGLVHWSRSNATAVRYSKTPPAFFTTSIYPPDQGLTKREVVLQLDPGGNLAGTVKTTYTGHEALVRRLEHIDTDEADKKAYFEKELTDILPMGAGVAMKRLENIGNNGPSLLVEYDVTIPGLVTSVGNRTLLPASPLLGAQQYPFRHSGRKYPVYFPFPFREFNDINITLPEGMTVETRPEPRKADLDFASYSLVCVQEAQQKLHVQRDLVIKKSFYPVDKYAALKAFYDQVRTIDEEQIILVRIGSLADSLRYQRKP